MFEVSNIFLPDILEQKCYQIWQYITLTREINEHEYVHQLIDSAKKYNIACNEMITRINEKTTQFIENIRSESSTVSLVDLFMQQYNLETEEGILLMYLVESLSRIPDKKTADNFIYNLLTKADWTKHIRQSNSLFVNTSTWGLFISSKVLNFSYKNTSIPLLRQLSSNLNKTVIRTVIKRVMNIFGNNFVIGQDIYTALRRAKSYKKEGYTYSFDMLGESALTKEDAIRYKIAYSEAIKAISKNNINNKNFEPDSISIKLSALHPCYEKSYTRSVIEDLTKTLLDLVYLGRKYDVCITVDAEQSDQLEIVLKIFERVYRHKKCKGWGKLGLAVQAYNKCALPILLWLKKISQEQGDIILIRLVKGAYWDSEIKHAQKLGMKNYPVFTRKESTDLSYLICAKFLLQKDTNRYLYPQFATHNPHTIVSILEMACRFNRFELQRLHGMADTLYHKIVEQEYISVRIYAPVGNHKDLLPYLIRRLLENYTTMSFGYQLIDKKVSIKKLVHHPFEVIRKKKYLHNPSIVLPKDIFSKRKNSSGLNIIIETQWKQLFFGVRKNMNNQWIFGSMINGNNITKGKAHVVNNPANYEDSPGFIYWTDIKQIEVALNVAYTGFQDWKQVSVEKRAKLINNFANLLEDNRDEFIALCHREAGKTVQDCIDEIREAVDFCRYYAEQSVTLFSKPTVMEGPTGEINELCMEGRGIFFCISPWNFPLAIFIGQIMAALSAGNTVLAKPAEQTSLIAARAVQLAWSAGIPYNAIQLLTGDGATISNHILGDSRLGGVCFTGSTDTAMIINRQLADRKGSIIPFVAETGGQNAMIVDSTALPEQVVQDVIRSAFSSAGQRCSALRVLFVQEDIFSRIADLLKGAMRELVVGNPANRETDIGPVIDKESENILKEHINSLKKSDELIAYTPLGEVCNKGFFVSPIAFKIKSILQLKKEYFGPILHIITFKFNELDKVIEEINTTGFGLTLGIHSRDSTVFEYIANKINVGNIYINRNQVGAAIGVQPFGGMGLSGTGPKAGGPHYLYRFIVEKHYCINTTAIGGNFELMMHANE